MVISKENYAHLIDHIYSEYQRYCSGVPTSNDFERFKNIYLFRLGLDAKQLSKYKQPSNIQVNCSDKRLRTSFINHFAGYNPQLKLDPLTGMQVVEMPPHFLNNLYKSYYQNIFAEINITTDLAQLKEQEAALKKLLQAISQNKFILNGINRLLLDYDNSGDHILSTRQACEAYALLLRIFAAVNRDNLSASDYQRLLTASIFLVARDKSGVYRQSLVTELEAFSYIRNRVYEHARGEIPDIKGENPLFHELPPPYDKLIPELIQNNINDLLEGNSEAELNGESSFVSLRFLPNQHKRSQNDEILVRGGGHRNHFALFSLIKVGILDNGQPVGPGEMPHHYDYYKVEYNLGSQCPGVDWEAKTGWGTFVTKLTPFIYDQGGGLVPLSVDPYTHLELYQEGMETTIRELIRAEREIIFYHREGRDNTSPGSPQNLKEANEWARLLELKRLLSGFFYSLPVKYNVRDPINPNIYYERFVYNQRGFIQEEGSCPAFTLKSWLNSILGHELNSLLNLFGQQHKAEALALAVRSSLSRVQARIRQLEPLEIKGTSRELQTLFEAFKKHLGVGVQMSGVSFEKTGRGHSSSCAIKISNNLYKILWDDFFEEYNRKQYSKMMSNRFFPQSFGPGAVRIMKRSEHADEVVESLARRQVN